MNSIAVLTLSVLTMTGTNGSTQGKTPAKLAAHVHYSCETTSDCGDCEHCGRSGRDGCGHHCVRRELLRPCGNLYPHLPYEAHPKTYYYFRPYNYLHIQQQQAEAVQFGADPRAPYSNAMFREVYDEIE